MEEYIVSARKYRPATFDAVVGQSALTTTLKNAVKTGRLAHAYLFCGPRGVGKTTCARIFAKAINCSNPTSEGEACNACESCMAFNEGRSLNIFELDAASNNGVEQIKTLMEQTRIPPQIGKYKVFIIDEVHMLSTSAFNAFLKTLEEPPAHVVFILATTEKQKILPTILSRCQIYDFERMSVPAIVNHLKMVAEQEHIQYEEPALAVIAEKADGGMRDALSIFDQAASFSQGNVTYQKVIEDLNVLDSDYYFRITDLALENKAAEIMALLNTIIGKGFDAIHLVNGLASHLRNVLMAKDEATLPLLEVSEQQREKYREQAKKCPIGFAYKALKILTQCDISYRQSSNKRLLVEISLIQVAQITQPEDSEKPVAGRSPKQLKSLFKKLTTPRQKAEEQVSAAENSPQTSKKAVVRQTVVNQPSDSQPNNEPRKAPLKMGNIGFSFSEIRKQSITEPATSEILSAGSGENTPFTQAELELQWLSMCNRMPHRLVGLAARIKHVRPIITQFPNIEAVVDNGILLDQIAAIKGNIRATLAKHLHNDNIQITLRQAQPKEIKAPLSPRETLEEMRKNSPAIAHLCDELGVELA